MEKRIVTFRNVSFRYREYLPWVLNNVSFSINADEWVAIIGHNGSGKSTIAKLMNGLLTPQEGEILVNGTPVTPETIWEIRKNIGMVFQNPDNQFVGTTVQDDVAFGLENRGFPRKEMVKRIKQTLLQVGMEAYTLHEPHRLSGGQKQRVAIAGVLAIAPQVIILDEATAMLDPRGRLEIMKTMHHVKEQHNVSFIMITHDLKEVVRADRVIVMSEGNVVDIAPPRDIFAKKEKLQQIGLDIPFVAKLADELTKLGTKLSKEPLNQDELLEELWTLYLKT
ncbi:energy-coupling factor ABC transporter ATP-binding protein [Terrihalobacillus insolitus]|uniref:energy-coupling factor ABC transporter ATP-binding protein n=1 Tax=Terrihalobacillus insolitus TaxID=2950438 RepID=UPI00233FD224|nr:energy-coupling factor ABC transporter ATP-binding protein [Terrihalobacillus insolitus]MDC3414612.1 energy-coupling factor ABC transporter ATP-binding protein [Terrihalobacillus insolitus]